MGGADPRSRIYMNPISVPPRGNIGAPLEVRFTSSITLRNTLFVGNRNMYPAPYDQNETTVDQLYQTIITGGGFTFFTRTIPATILISNCTFLDNQAGHNLANSTRPVLLKANGHGGGVILRLANTSNSSVVIENSRFDSNLAEVDGGGVYVSLSQGASYNRLVMINNTFVNNVVQNASGGAVSVNSFLISFNNTLMVINNLFVNNTANAGEGGREGGRKGGRSEGARKRGREGEDRYVLITR